MVNITKRSGSTCFVCKIARLRNIGIRMIDLDAMGSIILDRAVGLTKRCSRFRYHFAISDFNRVVIHENKGYVVARFKNMGVDQEIIFALQRTKMGWRIADIRYKDGRSLWKILKG